MIYCQKCGAQNDDNAQFCVGCGTPFAQPQKNDVVSKQPGKGLAIASLVCGIVSFFWAGIVLGILALIFGGVAKSKGYKGGMATAGIVLGIIGLALYIILFVFLAELLEEIFRSADFYSSFYQYY